MRNFLYIILIFLISCFQKEQEKKIVKTEEDIQIERINAEIEKAKIEVEKIVPIDSIYNFFHSALKNNRVFNECECLAPDYQKFIALNIDQSEEFFSLLNAHINVSTEKEFIKKQYLASFNFQWDENLVTGKRIVRIDNEIYNSQDDIKELSDFMERNDCCLTSVSMPIFFNNFNNCVIEINYYCGFLCAEKATYIYERSANGKWQEIKEFGRIIS